jgi:hypothetical protein
LAESLRKSNSFGGGKIESKMTVSQKQQRQEQQQYVSATPTGSNIRGRREEHCLSKEKNCGTTNRTELRKLATLNL